MADDTSDGFVYFNGVDGDTGAPLIRPQLIARVIEMALKENLDAEAFAAIRQRIAAGEPSFGLPPAVDPTRLEEAGWGYLVASDEDPEVLEALQPLLALREAQAGARFYAWVAEKAYRVDQSESKYGFLRRLQIHLQGFVDPDKAPYYLLIVGSPEKIPFRFQYDMDVEFAVGRLHFDTPAEYRRYAESVVAAEMGKVVRSRTVAVFGVKNSGDPNTDDSMAHLVLPLAVHLRGSLPRARGSWTVHEVLGEDATKDRLTRLLGGADTPALLFTASHGMAFKSPGPQQREQGGAIICQEFVWFTKPDPHVYFAGTDLTPAMNVHGMINFHFACHSAGTPSLDDYVFEGAPKRIAEMPFVARLPQRLLAHPNGGALAVVGHVNTAIGDSYRFSGSTDEQLVVYKTALGELMRGMPIGWAMEGFGARYGNVTVALEGLREDIKYGKDPLRVGKDIARLWLSKIDARAFTILGDPAVRVCTAG